MYYVVSCFTSSAGREVREVRIGMGLGWIGFEHGRIEYIFRPVTCGPCGDLSRFRRSKKYQGPPGGGKEGSEPKYASLLQDGNWTGRGKKYLQMIVEYK